MQQNTKLNTLYTRWGEALNKENPLPEYPRPQMRRPQWQNLNGLWAYAILEGPPASVPEQYEGEIVVPFSPECALSGVGRQLLPRQTLWYRRSAEFTCKPGERVLLHFGAVDQQCSVYCNGKPAGRHEGGYWPFCFDITALLQQGKGEITLAVTDDSNLGDEAYGKQKLQRGGIWYTPQSGIWQTVWAETVPQQYITSYEVTPLYDESAVLFQINWSEAEPLPHMQAEIYDGETLVATGIFTGNTLRLPLPRFKSWSPDSPFLYDVVLQAGHDSVRGYFGMRKFGTLQDKAGHPRLALNNKPLFHSGLLDQGYWSDGLYTPPSDDAMAWEIGELRRLGFNMLRKHIKIEPLRWYYHCDRLGMLVWQDFVSGGGPYNATLMNKLPFFNIQLGDERYNKFGRKSAKGRANFERDMCRTVNLLRNCTSIAVWVPFNESWGQFESVRICNALRQMDTTRQIDHASGWYDQGAGDFCSKHIYYKQYKIKPDKRGRVQALTEFGGYSSPATGHMAADKLFGYRMYPTHKALSEAVEQLYRNEVIANVPKGLAAAIYTQVSDVEDEINGIFSYDRAVCKLDEEVLQRINKELVGSAPTE